MNQRKLDVLLIEDDLISQKMASYILKRMSCNVEVVECGQEALRRLVIRHFDVVFVDLGLPDMEGIDIVNQINAIKVYNGNLVKIILTAYLDNITLKKLRHVGVEDILLKPLNPSNCKEVLRQHFAEL